MGLFGLFKKSPAQPYNPYKDSATNVIYNQLFCDDPALIGERSADELQKIIDDPNEDPRIKALAYKKQFANGHQPNKKELLAVIVEIGLERGLDVLASFNNGTARYINQTGKLLIWETTADAKANELTKDLFEKSRKILERIGRWNQPRRPYPAKGNARLTFLVSDGLYFGEGPIDALFNDPLANPALISATQLMQYLTEKSLSSQ